MGKKRRAPTLMVAIPEPIQQQANAIIKDFNERVIRNSSSFYQGRFRGRYLYLDRLDFGRLYPVFRLTYTGSIDDWEFAIFKYSTDKYDEEEYFFPGAEHLDGTLAGALQAGLEAYP